MGAHVNEVAGMPYLGFPAYVAKCEDVAANGYAGFLFSAA